MTLLDLWDLLGVKSDDYGGFYDQSWWQDQAFARKERRPGQLGRPSSVLDPSMLPRAVDVAWGFFRADRQGRYHYCHDHYLWTCDVDDQGDRIYVGGYEFNRPGFEVHRHLTIRDKHLTIPWHGGES